MEAETPEPLWVTGDGQRTDGIEKEDRKGHCGRKLAPELQRAKRAQKQTSLGLHLFSVTYESNMRKEIYYVIIK